MDTLAFGASLSFELILMGSATSNGVNSFLILNNISLHILFLLSNIVGKIELTNSVWWFRLLNSTILFIVFSREAYPSTSVDAGITTSLAYSSAFLLSSLHEGGQSRIIYS